MKHIVKSTMKNFVPAGCSVMFVVALVAIIFFIRAMSSPSVSIMLMQGAGKHTALMLDFFDRFPREDKPFDFAEFMNEWQGDVPDATPSREKLYYDPNIWTVIQNIPTNPPANLVVMATRNVDPSSLRTRVADDEMQKSIRFVPIKNLPVVKKLLPLRKGFAALVRADFTTVIVTQGRPETMTYDRIYKSMPFDAATNPDGTQVKYLTFDGKEWNEVVPAND